MKRSLLSLAMLFLLTFSVSFAGHVEPQKARLAARNFIFERLRNNLHQDIQAEDIVITGEFIEKEGEIILCYIFNTSPSGYIILSADDACWPVLGYSLTSSWNPDGVPENLAYWLYNYKYEIKSVIDGNLPADMATTATWNRLTSADPSVLDNTMVTSDVAPLVTSLWNQDFPNNGMCPEDAGSTGSYFGRVPVGCVATSMTQIMHYWRYPATGQGYHCIFPTQAAYGPQCADFSLATYDWNAMPDQTSLESEALALVSWHAGIGVDMQYDPAGSGSNLQKSANAMKIYFKYGSSTQFMNRNSNYNTWVNILKDDVDAGKPVQYAGDDNYAGHAFVLDGYQQVGTDYMFHFNWGWGGSYNGYFYVNNLNPGGSNFNYHQSAVVHIAPDATAYPAFCSGNNVINTTFGSIEDGSGPIADYQSGANCSWLIAPDDSVSKITLTFSHFNTATGDEVKVYDGENASAPLLATYSGAPATMPVVSSTGPKMYITFTSDGSNQAPGWRANYTSTPQKFCDATTNLTSAWGTISDGSGRFDYRNVSNCRWKILPPGASKIVVTINSFSTEQDADKLQIYDLGTGNQIANLSGEYTTMPGPFTSETGQVMIMWTTNNSVRGEGWEISYSPMVSTGENSSFGDVLVYPNPASDLLNLRFKSNGPGNVSITMMNAGGSTVYSTEVQQNTGELVHSIPVEKLARGIYMLRLQSSEGTIVRKVALQ